MSIKYKIKNYQSGRLLEYKHKDNTLIYGSSLASLIETIQAYNNIYYKGEQMSFVIYGTDNSKRVVVANNIHEAYNSFVSGINKYFLKNYNYKIERLY